MVTAEPVTKRSRHDRAEKVIVTRRGGSASRAALEWVVDHARHTRSAVTVVAVDVSDAQAGEPERSANRGRLSQVLDEAESYLEGSEGILSVAPTLLVDWSAGQLRVVKVVADLFVVGTGATDVVASSLNETLAMRLAARARCPLAVIPSGWTAQDGQVIVGIDDHRSSRVALEAAVADARLTGRDLKLVHSWTVPTLWPRRWRYPTLEKTYSRVMAVAAERAQHLAPRIRIVKQLSLSSALDSLMAESRPGNVIYLGCHHHGRHLAQRSLCWKMLQAPKCPIVIVPSHNP